MNSTGNKTFLSLDTWFNLFGQTKTFDYLFIGLQFPVCIVAFLFNLLTFSVMQKKAFLKSPFFKYMKCYTLNSIFLSLVLTTAFIPGTKRIFKFTNSYGSYVYGSYLYAFLVSTLFLNSSLLEIAMVAERALFFLPARFKKIKIVRVYQFCFVFLALSVIVSLPMIVLFVPGHLVVPLDENTLVDIYFWNSSPFSLTFAGQVVANIMYFIRDIIGPILKLILNVFVVVLVKKYIKRIKLDKMEFSLRISTTALHEKNKVNQSVYVNVTDTHQTYLAIIMCSFSFIEHFFYIFSFVVYFLKLNQYAGLFYYLAILSIGIKHLSNFFVFYKFNFLFRNEINKIFNKNGNEARH